MAGADGVGLVEYAEGCSPEPSETISGVFHPDSLDFVQIYQSISQFVATLTSLPRRNYEIAHDKVCARSLSSFRFQHRVVFCTIPCTFASVEPEIFETVVFVRDFRGDPNC